MWESLVIVMFWVMFIYLFVWIDPHGDGILSQTRRFLFLSVPSFLKKWGIRLWGHTIISYIERFFLYFWYQKNPAVQIFYLLLMTIGYYYYYYHGLTPLVPNMYISKYHKILVHLAFCSWMIIFVIASRAKPGQITKENNKMYLDRYPPDGSIYK